MENQQSTDRNKYEDKIQEIKNKEWPYNKNKINYLKDEQHK